MVIGMVIVNVIDFVTIATTGNAQDFGDLVNQQRWKGGVSMVIEVFLWVVSKSKESIVLILLRLHQLEMRLTLVI